jgi:hypothetical protein
MMHMRARPGVCVAALAIAGLLAATAPAAEPPPLDLLVQRASEYVLDFVAIFSNVVAEEQYMQTWRGVRRYLTSDFLLVQPKDSPDYFALRDVRMVNGSPVTDRGQRVMKLLTDPAGSTLDQMNDIAKESGRFTFGGVFNSPVAAIALLQPAYRDRFRFSLRGMDRAVGPDAWEVGFQEQVHPSVFTSSPRGPDVEASGRLWIDADSGRILQSELLLGNDSIVTRFAFDERFHIAVPVAMTDRYRYMNNQVDGTATYGRFRRFGVTTEEKVE